VTSRTSDNDAFHDAAAAKRRTVRFADTRIAGDEDPRYERIAAVLTRPT